MSERETEIALAIALLLLGSWLVGAVVGWIRAEREERKWRSMQGEKGNLNGR